MGIETKIKEAKQKISVLLPQYIDQFDALDSYITDDNIFFLRIKLALTDDYKILFDEMLSQIDVKDLTKKQKTELYKIFCDLLDFINDL